LRARKIYLGGIIWRHHKEVAALSPEQRQEALRIAGRDGLSTREIKLLAKQEMNHVGTKYDTCTNDDLTRLIERGADVAGRKVVRLSLTILLLMCGV
jgi:hypothetical protein